MIDLNYIAKWASFYFFAFASLSYFYHALKYSGWLSKNAELTSEIEIKLQKLNSLTHFLIASQMILGLYQVIKLNPKIAAAHVGFSGLSMIVLSLAKLILFDKKNHKASTEISLTLLGFFFLSFHILSRFFN